MRTIQMTLDDDLVKAVDRVSEQTPYQSVPVLLREALAGHPMKQLEHKHRKGYELQPTAADEFTVWENEQTWGDE